MDQTLRRQEILKGHGSFSRVFNSNRVFSSEYFKLFVNTSTEKEYNETRFSPLLKNLKVGFIVSKKSIRKASDRNYLKRLLRELYRLNKKLIFTDRVIEVIFSFNSTAINLFSNNKFPSFNELNDDFLNLINKFNRHSQK